VRAENEQLKALLELQSGAVEPIATTRMIGASAASSRRFGYIGAGSEDGVEVGMPVRSARGIVGRVLETGRHNARVLLLTDRESVLPVRRVEGDVVAFAQGRGDGLLHIRLINLGLNPLEEGDVFVTSGAGGYFHPGVSVAIVEELTDDGALARIISDPAATDFVVVQPVFQPAAIRAAQVPPGSPLEPEPEPEAAMGQ
jgi:rod shape-determining protein MreC